MVARQDPQPARVDGQRFVKRELHREVAHGVYKFRDVARGPGVRRRQIGVEVLFYACKSLGRAAGHERFVGNLSEQVHGIMMELCPSFGIERTEKIRRVGVPTPPEVVSKVVEARTDGMHVAATSRVLRRKARCHRPC